MAFVTRAQWGARPPRERTRMAGPARGVARHYEGVKLGAYDHSSCARRVRDIQGYHMDRNGWDDIAYSFIVCRHGYVFEGRWANVRTAANGTNAANANYYAGCVLMGPGDEFTTESKMGWLEGRAELRRITGAGAETPSHSQLTATACPGGPFRDWKFDDGIPAPIGVVHLQPAPIALANNDYSVEAIVTALPVLRQGANGQHVRILQGLLIANGRPLTVDGDFGATTNRLLTEWQGAAGLAADGIAGPITWRRLHCI